MRIHGIVLAAGKSSRFGKNKLVTRLAEKDILEYTLEKLYTLDLAHISIVVNEVTQNVCYHQEKATLLTNRHPEEGISHSIQLALQKGDTYDAYLFIVGDQPLIHKETLEGLLKAYQSKPGRIIGLGKDGVLGNPIIFPRLYRPLLKTLKGDRGGKYLIQQEKLPYTIFEVSEPEELWDIDTQQDFEHIKRRMTHGITTT